MICVRQGIGIARRGEIRRVQPECSEQSQVGLLHRGRRSLGMIKCRRRSRRVRPVLPPKSAFAGFRFPREVIVLAVRWYLRYGLSYRDVEELLAGRGVQVDHVTI